MWYFTVKDVCHVNFDVIIVIDEEELRVLTEYHSGWEGYDNEFSKYELYYLLLVCQWPLLINVIRYLLSSVSHTISISRHCYHTWQRKFLPRSTLLAPHTMALLPQRYIGDFIIPRKIWRLCRMKQSTESPHNIWILYEGLGNWCYYCYFKARLG